MRQRYQIEKQQKCVDEITDIVREPNENETVNREVETPKGTMYEVYEEKVIMPERVKLWTFPVASKVRHYGYAFDVERGEDGEVQELVCVTKCKNMKRRYGGEGFKKKPEPTQKVRRILKDKFGENVVVSSGK